MLKINNLIGFGSFAEKFGLGNIGTPTVFESATSLHISVASLTSTKAIVCYRDSGNGSYGTACILDVSAGTITPGTPAVFESAVTNYTAVAALSSTKAIVSYSDNGNGSYGTACVLDVTDSTITPGTPAVFESSATVVTSITVLTSTKAIVAYQDGGNGNAGTACILDISGSAITPGTPVVFAAGTTQNESIATLTSTKAIVSYTDVDNSSYGTACILDISGSTITPGTPAVFESAASAHISLSGLASSKAVVSYRDVGNSDYGTACVLDVSGSTITPGTPAVFESSAVTYTSIEKMLSNRAVVSYSDNGNGSYGTACVLNISGDTITSGTPAVFESAVTAYITVAALSSTKAIVTYRDEGNSNYGTACILQ